MKVFKFGGASVKDAAAVRNTASILQRYQGQQIVIVVSAIGKTTNALEKIVHLFRSGGSYINEMIALTNYHHAIINELFANPTEVLLHVNEMLNDLESSLNHEDEDDQLYDKVVSKGELISSTILFHYLKEISLPVTWIDARQYIITDENYREAKIDWEITCQRIQQLKKLIHDSIIVTQGFIGCTPGGNTTTLGREGSDFSAAIFASCMHAESVTIWKDVPGVMTADPKRLRGATVFRELPYKEAAEMTYYGASVIHPKTIKPLANKNIPLLVKNFDDPSLPGTIIHDCVIEHMPALVVFKENQCLISCKVTDYTFINEQQLSSIFHALSDLGIRINVMQNSAITFSFCIDFRESKVSTLIARLQENFEVYYNAGLTLVTVKNYDLHTYDHYRNLPSVLIEQSSRSTLQVLVRNF